MTRCHPRRRARALRGACTPPVRTTCAHHRAHSYGGGHWAAVWARTRPNVADASSRLRGQRLRHAQPQQCGVAAAVWRRRGGVASPRCACVALTRAPIVIGR